MDAFLDALSDEELLRALTRLVKQERENTVEVLRHIGEVDHREAFAPAGYSSMFVYCVRRLAYSEGEAYRRIHAARTAREFPLIYAMLKSSSISLTTVSLLAPHLCRENHRQLLESAAGKSRMEVENLVASFAPRLEPVDRIRHLGIREAQDVRHRREEGSSGQAELPCGPETPGKREPPRGPETSGKRESPSGPESPRQGEPPRGPARPLERRISLSFAASETLLDKIRRAREVLRHKYPSGKLEFIMGDALEELLERRDPERRLVRLAKRRKRATEGRRGRAGR